MMFGVVFEIYKASVIWDGQEQIIDVAASDAELLSIIIE
jgi:hypothetical protein